MKPVASAHTHFFKKGRQKKERKNFSAHTSTAGLFASFSGPKLAFCVASVISTSFPASTVDAMVDYPTSPDRGLRNVSYLPILLLLQKTENPKVKSTLGLPRAQVVWFGWEGAGGTEESEDEVLWDVDG